MTEKELFEKEFVSKCWELTSDQEGMAWAAWQTRAKLDKDASKERDKTLGQIYGFRT